MSNIPYPALDVAKLAADIADRFGTARQAAIAAGLAESTVRRILYGHAQNPSKLAQLARALGHAPSRYRLPQGGTARGVTTLPRRQAASAG